LADIHRGSGFDQNLEDFAAGGRRNRHGCLVGLQFDNVVIDVDRISDFDKYLKDIARINAFTESRNFDFDCHIVCGARLRICGKRKA
jgi:hypothetical protein